MSAAPVRRRFLRAGLTGVAATMAGAAAAASRPNGQHAGINEASTREAGLRGPAMQRAHTQAAGSPGAGGDLDIARLALLNTHTGESLDVVYRERGQYLTDASYADAVGRAHGAVFAEVRPASTMIVVAALLDPRWKVEIEAEAIIDE